MPAKRRLDRLADFARLEQIHGALEIGHRVPGKQPVEVAAARRTAVRGVLARLFGEIRAAGDDALAQILKPAARVSLGNDFVGPHQDVPRVGLLDGRALLRAALLHQLDDMEASRTAQYRADFAGTQAFRGLGEKLGQPVLSPPAHVPALERIWRVRIGRRDLGEVRA